MATLQDIANEAHVSKTTVSYVFNNKTQKVSPEMRQKILAIAKRMNYQPNKIAAALVRKKLETICLMLQSDTDAQKRMFKDMIAGMLMACTQRNYRLLIDVEKNSGKPSEFLVSKTDLYDGAIIQAPLAEDYRIGKMVENQVPFVLIGSVNCPQNTGLLSVDVDNRKIAYTITRHLLELGHTVIGFINSQAEMTVSMERLNGYQKALQEAGVAFKPSLVANGDNTQKTGEPLCLRLYRDNPNMTAVLTSSDDTAVGVYHALTALGKGIPEDISVLALGGDDFYQMLNPVLSTVRIDYTRIGNAAGNLLIDYLTEKDISQKQIYIDPIYDFSASCSKKN